jgi:hypothetical protein
MLLNREEYRLFQWCRPLLVMIKKQLLNQFVNQLLLNLYHSQANGHHHYHNLYMSIYCHMNHIY